MSLTGVFDLCAAILSLVAALFIFDQYLTRPRPYKLLWTLGLVFYGIGAAAVVVGEVAHWSVADFKTWYFFGGILTAAYLGLGSLYLLAPRRVAQVAVAVAALLSVYAAIRIALLPIDTATAAHIASQPTSAITSRAFLTIIPGDLRAVAIIMNIMGGLLLFGGAAWSAWTFYRKHAPGYRLVSMVLLALGSVFPSFLTGFQALGNSGGAALGEFLGAGCILGGLVISLDVFTVFRVPFTHIVLRERTAQQVASQGGAQSS